MKTSTNSAPAVRHPPPSCFYQTARFLAEQGFMGVDQSNSCVSPKTGKSQASQQESSENISRFHKTRMCLFHQKGACIKGSDCSYAHEPDELKAAPDLMKTRLCQDWLNGRCISKKCKFAHGRNELRFTHDYYKTKICHFWQQGGCTKGDDCRHAHGEHELRPLPTDVQRKSSSSDDGSVEMVPRPSRQSASRTPKHTGRQAQVMEALRLADEARKLAQKSADLLDGRPGVLGEKPNDVDPQMVFACGTSEPASKPNSRDSSSLHLPPFIPLSAAYMQRSPTPAWSSAENKKLGDTPRLSFLSGCTTDDTAAPYELDSLAETLTNLLLSGEADIDTLLMSATNTQETLQPRSAYDHHFLPVTTAQKTAVFPRSLIDCCAVGGTLRRHTATDSAF